MFGEVFFMCNREILSPFHYEKYTQEYIFTFLYRVILCPKRRYNIPPWINTRERETIDK